MFAPLYNLPPLFVLAIAGSLASIAHGQIVVPKSQAQKRVIEASTTETVDASIIVLDELIVRTAPRPNADEVQRLRVGDVATAIERNGQWFRIALDNKKTGWVLARDNNFSISDSNAVQPRIPRATSAGGGVPVLPDLPPRAIDANANTEILIRRPLGADQLRYSAPAKADGQIASPSPLLPRVSIPVPDRWRIMEGLGFTENWLNPYDQNTLKGDKPFPWLVERLGPDWFLNVGAISDSLTEFRATPIPIGAQSSRRPSATDIFGRENQTLFAQNIILSLSIVKGNTTFKPPDYEFKFSPVINVNHARAEEVRALRVDPLRGAARTDFHVGVQELFADIHLRNVSDSYDFDSVRIGIQPFISDFRGFLLQDVPFGVRLFGNRENNRFQYNLGLFRKVEKDTNSGLNDLTKRLRADDTLVANLYWQDLPTLGFTAQGSIVHNRNREDGGFFYNRNGALERPSIVGDETPHRYHVTYFGLNGDGHFGVVNVTASTYAAFGAVKDDPIAHRRQSIQALFAAAEISRDFDWLRVRGSALYASGDRNPFDGKATGYDAIFENPQFAGADTSFWIRQSIPLIGGGGVALSGRNGILSSLRSSIGQGQSNFANPGLRLVGVGADADLTPRWRLFGNINALWFDNTSSLSVLRNQGKIASPIGIDVSMGTHFRPFFNQNVVLNLSGAVLIPGKGLNDLFPDRRLRHSLVSNLILAY